ncbi:hypothetical protein A6U87_24350 [Rhizobium sp. AC44/96]|jgi:hypothetical protein|uniref:hypothetical protein n=1 Tax=unclassified Rhizobium TaxID=2613769 RepID=UPI00080F9F4E|nr:MULTISPECIES: hypothetical protein [unclassified Rhizobium]MDM9619544.1 hypothetical protein [Rhizobium sp. S96]OCJ15259.1 hypothetical protein A6U87_24350 [Rhizobium sp. AC44/96]
MRFAMVIPAVLVIASALAPATAFATDWKRAGETRVQPLYPYTDLPGVKAQPDKTEEEQFTCRTETQQIRRRYDEIFRSGMPTLVYVCDRDGFGSTGTLVPRRGRYQPVR